MSAPADLTAFKVAEFASGGITRPVYQGGSGPAVIVVHEIPGVTPKVAAFARRVIDVGFTVYMPSLVGEPGRAWSVPYVARSFASVCVAREFTMFAKHRSGAIVDWLRALARKAHEDCGGPGVGALGMCFSGGFALAMAVDDVLLAPVLSQPSSPFGIGIRRKSSIDITPEALDRVRQRTVDDGLCVLGLRFTEDVAVPPERFAMLRRELGANFLAVDIDSSKGNPHGIGRRSHSVLTEHFVDEPGHPTRAALDQVLAFFIERLGSTSAAPTASPSSDPA